MIPREFQCLREDMLDRLNPLACLAAQNDGNVLMDVRYHVVLHRIPFIDFLMMVLTRQVPTGITSPLTKKLTSAMSPFFAASCFASSRIVIMPPLVMIILPLADGAQVYHSPSLEMTFTYIPYLTTVATPLSRDERSLMLAPSAAVTTIQS